jgi:hypothetical protein
MSKTATEEKRLRAYETIVSLYDKAEPIIQRISDLNTFKYGELPLNPYMLVEAGITLRMVLQALKKIHDPQDRELAIIQREFEISLSNCIKAADHTEKYVELSDTTKSRIILNTIINSTVMANEYMTSVSKRLEAFNSIKKVVIQPQKPPHIVQEIKIPEIVKDDIKVHPKTPEVKDEVKNREIAKEEPKPRQQKPSDKKTGGVVSILDKIGDIVIFPIVKMAELSDLKGKSGKKQ